MDWGQGINQIEHQKKTTCEKKYYPYSLRSKTSPHRLWWVFGSERMLCLQFLFPPCVCGVNDFMM